MRFVFVDALRGIAALAVVLFHAAAGHHIPYLPLWIREVVSHGDLGVAVFFVLSGFVISHTLRQAPTLSGVGSFMLRRSIRLDPPYWVAIALAIGFSTLATMTMKERTPDVFSVVQLVAHIFYFQDILGFKNINPVFWTLCYEVQFYLVFALLLATKSRVLLIAAFVISLLWPLGLVDDIRGLFVNLWYGFLLGAGAYMAWAAPRNAPWFLSYAAILASAAIFFHNDFAIVCAVTSLALYVIATTGRLTSALNWRWLQFLGSISYSLYLIHNPITGAVFRIGKMLTGDTAVTEVLWWAVSIAACIVCAYVMWRWVERPSMMLSKRLFNSPKLEIA